MQQLDLVSDYIPSGNETIAGYFPPQIIILAQLFTSS